MFIKPQFTTNEDDLQIKLIENGHAIPNLGNQLPNLKWFPSSTHCLSPSFTDAVDMLT
jgi:hypothetical protein